VLPLLEFVYGEEITIYTYSQASTVGTILLDTHPKMFFLVVKYATELN
jgi:hypothetical protein